MTQHRSSLLSRRRWAAPLALALSLAGRCGLCQQGETRTIEFFRASFLPQVVEVALGERVVFRWVRGDHVVASGEGPGDPRAGEIFEARLDESSPEFELAIDAGLIARLEEGSRGVGFFDRLNPQQVGFIEISSGEETVRVGIVDNAFLPAEVFIFAGDSIRWEHEPMEDVHTITSGLSSRPEHDPGALFDVESSDALPIFVHRFAEPGETPYFCRPHEEMGMKGRVVVQAKFVRGDTTRDGRLDLTDAVATLGYLFLGGAEPPCADAQDCNDDGAVDIADAVFTLTYLFLGGVEAPAPFPFPGADRTPDALFCF